MTRLDSLLRRVVPRPSFILSALTCSIGLVLIGAAGCGDPSADVAEPTAAESSLTESSLTESSLTESSPTAAEPARRDPDSSEIVIVFLGDSLTAGYGLDENRAFPPLVAQAFTDEGFAVRHVNAGISGDTTAGGLRRMDWLLRQQPDILVVSLGANDGLRGLDLEQSESNLRQIIEMGKEAGARVLLSGMLIPPNYGEDYTSRFRDMFPRLAAEQDIALLPFLLDGVAGDSGLNQADRIHPTAEGQKIIASTMVEALRPLVEAERAERSPAPR